MVLENRKKHINFIAGLHLETAFFNCHVTMPAKRPSSHSVTSNLEEVFSAPKTATSDGPIAAGCFVSRIGFRDGKHGNEATNMESSTGGFTITFG